MERRQAAEDFHNGEHHRHVSGKRDVAAINNPRQVTKVPAKSEP